MGSSKSSFWHKISHKANESGIPEYEGDFLYIGIHCEVIDLEPQERQKFARLAIEDAIHTEYLMNKNFFGSEKHLLSTSKPITRHKFGFDVDSFAKAAIDLIHDEYTKSGGF